MAERNPQMMTLGQLLPDINLPTAVAGIPIAGLALDSRQIRAGQVFIAVRGSVSHGIAYVDDALRNGAVCVLTDQFAGTLGELAVPLVVVTDLAAKVSAIAGQFFGMPSATMDVIAVTGTNGKTTTASLLADLLARVTSRRAGYIGTLGSGEVGQLAPGSMTTPDAVETQRLLAGFKANGLSYAVLEASSHALDQARLAAVNTRCAVFTNLTRDHLDYHGSMASYRAAKEKVFQLPGITSAVLNIDDAAGLDLAGSLPATLICWTYSIRRDAVAPSPLRHVLVESIGLAATGSQVRIHSSFGTQSVDSPLVGEFNASNLAAIIASALALGLSWSAIIAAIPTLHQVPGRLQRVGDAKPVVYVDYAHTPDALEKALHVLRPITRGKLWCVFGCGGDRDRGKRPLMGAVAEQCADVVVLTSDNPRGEQPAAIVEDIRAGMHRDVHVELDRAAAIGYAVNHAAADDVVLIAGKGHEKTQQIGPRIVPFDDVVVVAQAQQERRS
ncbi:MAG: UDP-N-acetylmuramoyl-L-alanyl-D-glutamate--2,6-diaminopimelate ligase [Gammaproteobacteria bacterium]|nr:UDP-N-acetylmuramoyl-L-alanyl-D-glutamate--2,6-diaminopimelate ligase [Gammaproteobacteria bacterium]